MDTEPAGPHEYLVPLGLRQLVVIQVPRKYRHAKLLKALTVVAHHYGARQKDIHQLDPLTHEFSDSPRAMAQNANTRSLLCDAFNGKSQKFGVFELWTFDGEAVSLTRPRISEP